MLLPDDRDNSGEIVSKCPIFSKSEFRKPFQLCDRSIVPFALFSPAHFTAVANPSNDWQVAASATSDSKAIGSDIVRTTSSIPHIRG